MGPASYIFISIFPYCNAATRQTKVKAPLRNTWKLKPEFLAVHDHYKHHWTKHAGTCLSLTWFISAWVLRFSQLSLPKLPTIWPTVYSGLKRHLRLWLAYRWCNLTSALASTVLEWSQVITLFVWLPQATFAVLTRPLALNPAVWTRRIKKRRNLWILWTGGKLWKKSATTVQEELSLRA